MIESIHLRNYRGHTDTTVSCGRLTLLVGENASGKTSVLRAVDWISQGIHDTAPASLLRHGTSEMLVRLTGRSPDYVVKLNGGELRPDLGAEKSWKIRATYRAPDGALEPVEANTGRSGDKQTADELRNVRSETSVLNDDGSVAYRPNAAFLSLSAEDLAAPSASKSVVPKLEPSGRGLASVLAYLKLAETERFQRIVEQLRRVVPIARGIGFARVEATESVSRLIRVEDQHVELAEKVRSIREMLLFDFVDAEKVPASVVSEGTLIALGLLTAIEVFQRERVPVIDHGVQHTPVDVVLIDDLDRGLHPRAQRELVATLKAALAATPNLQILATSHSPYLLDALEPEDVVVLGRDAQNAIVAKPLNTFPDQRLRKMLNTGELWMSEGDDWVAR